MFHILSIKLGKGAQALGFDSVHRMSESDNDQFQNHFKQCDFAQCRKSFGFQRWIMIDRNVCWAKGDGQCCGPITKEHVISDSILRVLGGKYTIRAADGSKKIFGARGLVISNLCEFHNNRLSIFDAEAKNLYENFYNYSIGKDFLESKTININGRLLDCWYAKTFLNLCIFRHKTFSKNCNYVPISTRSIHRKLFSEESFGYPFGLYLFDISNPVKANFRPTSIYPMLKSVKRVRAGSEDKEYEVPLALYTTFLGFEVIGYFNLTAFSDENFMEISGDFLSKTLTKENYRFCGGDSIGFGRVKDNSLSPALWINVKW